MSQYVRAKVAQFSRAVAAYVEAKYSEEAVATKKAEDVVMVLMSLAALQDKGGLVPDSVCYHDVDNMSTLWKMACATKDDTTSTLLRRAFGRLSLAMVEKMLAKEGES